LSESVPYGNANEQKENDEPHAPIKPRNHKSLNRDFRATAEAINEWLPDDGWTMTFREHRHASQPRVF
jgi:hypothetical protein